VQLPVNRCNCKNTKAYKRNSKRSHAAISEVSAQITVLQAQQDKLEIDRQDYQQNLPCPKLFTPDLNTGNLNLGSVTHSVAVHWLMWSGWVKPMPLTRCGNRCLATTDTYQGQFMPGGSGYSSSLFPNPRPGYTTLGAHNSPALGLLASTNRTAHRTQTGLPPSHSTSALVFWHIVSLTPRH